MCFLGKRACRQAEREAGRFFMGHSFRRGFLCNTYRLYLYYLEGGEIARELLRKWGCLVGDSPMFTLVIVLPGKWMFHNDLHNMNRDAQRCFHHSHSKMTWFYPSCRVGRWIWSCPNQRRQSRWFAHQRLECRRQVRAFDSILNVWTHGSLTIGFEIPRQKSAPCGIPRWPDPPTRVLRSICRLRLRGICHRAGISFFCCDKEPMQ